MASGQTASGTSSSTGSPYDGQITGRRRAVHIAGGASGKIVSGKASDTRAGGGKAGNNGGGGVLGVETAGMVALVITASYQPSPGDLDFWVQQGGWWGSIQQRWRFAVSLGVRAAG
jgi:hypothetical protein